MKVQPSTGKNTARATIKELKLRNRFLERKWTEAEKHVADALIERNEARNEVKRKAATMKDNMESSLRWFARQLYRFQMSARIFGVIVASLTFAGVFTLVLGPVLLQFGLSYLQVLVLLLVTVLTLFLVAGYILDRKIEFWAAETKVSVARNPYLLNRLYEKEYLAYKVIELPKMQTLRALLVDNGKHPELVAKLDESIARLKRVIENREWDVSQQEYVYEG